MGGKKDASGEICTIENFIFTVLLNVFKIDELGCSCSQYAENAQKYSFGKKSKYTKAFGRSIHSFEDNIRMILNVTEY